MAADVLIVYASKRGSTEQTARRIGEILRRQGLTTEVLPAREADDLGGFRAVVVAGSIYMGRWHHDSRLFLSRHRRDLERIPFAVFALGPGRNTEHDFEESRAQLAHSLERFPEIEPRTTAVFGGVIEPERLRFPLSHMERRDLRDWNEIGRWARSLPVELELEPVVHHREAVPF